ncbi:MAG: PKD domain-containing protein, partial [Chitinophagaceae bacterium]|nr:PKD domain-containing protein [Chitinophagaceae bacterium]
MINQKPVKRIAILFLSIVLFSQCNTKLKPAATKEKETGAREARQRDIRMMKDPALGYVPYERIIDAKEYKDQLMQTEAALSGVQWRSLGPKNQGGRSRTLLIDANDASGNTVFAASVGGGLWKTTNITAAAPLWAPVDDLMGNLAVTSIAQDPSNPLVMYLCTGEGFFNADAIRGLGIWKSTNGGNTWTQLASTNNSNFHYCQKIVVNSTGVVLVATHSGIRRSADGGTTWTKVLGAGMGITGANSNFSWDVEIAANGDIFGAIDGSIHKSTNAGVTFGAAQTLPITAVRIELACAPSDANYAYAVIENGNVVNGIIRTTNGGTTWTSRTEPADADPGVGATDFSRGQAWYDLSLAVDPNNRDRLFTGGIDLFVSSDGAGTWTQVSHWYGGFGFQYVHADQHNAIFKPGSSSEMYFTNDGGVYRSTNANTATPTITDKGTNYITAQFYACAMHPTAQTSYFLAGAQDNGSHQFSGEGVQNTIQVTGGDGAFCHIDQDQPQFQFTSYVYNDYYRSADGGATWTNITHSGSAGQFINPTDYDDVNNRLYACRNANQYVRWDNPQTGSTFTQVAVAGFGGQVSAIKVSPNTANRVFFGIDNGDVFRVDNAHTGAPTATNISTGLPAAYLSCIEVETGNDNHLLAMYSNYGVNSIWESTDGGTSWTSVEGNLPDMPVRWALFNPSNSDQAIIATELGVWSTDNLNGASTVWGASNTGLANVRVDMLQLRQSDKLVIAATHGRGLFSSDIFTTPTARFDADKKVSYTGATVNFFSTSYKGTSWSWDFGDGTNSTLENPGHAYAAAGKYNVTLTINAGASAITKNQFIHILPNKGTPYTIASGGGFEVNTDDFGVNHIAGTAWVRGNSAVVGKQGTHAGANAWVTGLVGNYVDNS